MIYSKVVPIRLGRPAGCRAVRADGDGGALHLRTEHGVQVGDRVDEPHAEQGHRQAQQQREARPDPEQRPLVLAARGVLLVAPLPVPLPRHDAPHGDGADDDRYDAQRKVANPWTPRLEGRGVQAGAGNEHQGGGDGLVVAAARREQDHFFNSSPDGRQSGNAWYM